MKTRVTTELAKKKSTKLVRLSAMLSSCNFWDQLRRPCQRVSAPLWPLIAVFPQDTPKLPRDWDEAALGRHRRALEIMEITEAWRMYVRTRSGSIRSYAVHCFHCAPPAIAKQVGGSA